MTKMNMEKEDSQGCDGTSLLLENLSNPFVNRSSSHSPCRWSALTESTLPPMSVSMRVDCNAIVTAPHPPHQAAYLQSSQDVQISCWTSSSGGSDDCSRKRTSGRYVLRVPLSAGETLVMAPHNSRVKKTVEKMRAKWWTEPGTEGREREEE